MSRSDELFQRAQQHIPGGVNSPVRAFKAVGGTPPFITTAKGAHIYDADSKAYIDYVQSWGPMILGHAHQELLATIEKAMRNGLSFGAPTELEVRMAEALAEIVPSIDMVRMVNSGTEATMSAIRLARAYTGRDKIIKFEGCYHAHSDSLLVKAGSGALTFGVPSSPGVPDALAEHTLTLTYNDTDQLRDTMKTLGSSIACIIVEPVAGNMNCIPPQPGFLQALRECCTEQGALLIFDEVMTGFRVALGGAQQRFGIEPDLTTLGKVIGGGMPVGAFGGKREIMQQLAPSGPVYQAGTLSGNPIAMAAGLRTLELISEEGFYQPIFDATENLVNGLREIANNLKISFTTNHCGSMFGFFFTEKEEVSCYSDVMACDGDRFNQFFHAMLEQGVYLAPASYEAGFVSAAHHSDIIDQTLEAAEKAFKTLTK